MATYQAIRTARLTDRQILDLIGSLTASVEVESGTIALGSHMNIDFDVSERSEEPLSHLDRDRHAIRYVHLITSSSIQIEFFRGICARCAENREEHRYQLSSERIRHTYRH